jgi:hypothetical protein
MTRELPVSVLSFTFHFTPPPTFVYLSEEIYAKIFQKFFFSLKLLCVLRISFTVSKRIALAFFGSDANGVCELNTYSVELFFTFSID